MDLLILVIFAIVIIFEHAENDLNFLKIYQKTCMNLKILLFNVEQLYLKYQHKKYLRNLLFEKNCILKCNFSQERNHSSGNLNKPLMRLW